LAIPDSQPARLANYQNAINYSKRMSYEINSNHNILKNPIWIDGKNTSHPFSHTLSLMENYKIAIGQSKNKNKFISDIYNYLPKPFQTKTLNTLKHIGGTKIYQLPHEDLFCLMNLARSCRAHSKYASEVAKAVKTITHTTQTHNHNHKSQSKTIILPWNAWIFARRNTAHITDQIETELLVHLKHIKKRLH
jgi:hypothetical protein